MIIWKTQTMSHFNTFGHILKLTSFGESHGKMIGGILDGIPSEVAINIDAIQMALNLRRPGHKLTSERQEKDQIKIVSGLENGLTTGAPLSFIIENTDINQKAYAPLSSTIRPGHANATYAAKYGNFSQSGGGRASARETAIRVGTGAIASQIIAHLDIEFLAWLDQAAHIKQPLAPHDIHHEDIYTSPIYCPDKISSKQIENLVMDLKLEKNSCAGVVGFCIKGLPAGLGEPIYQKLEASLACALMSIPASKGFEIGSGFSCLAMHGDEHNDIITSTTGTSVHNFSGGILGGISNGDPVYGRCVFKPTSSIGKEQSTLTFSGEQITINNDKNHHRINS